jgi:hypothetical protein
MSVKLVARFPYGADGKDHLAEIQLDRRRAPVHGEVIDVSVKRKGIRAKIVAFNTSTSGSTSTYAIEAVEEDEGNLPGHREGDEDDF